MILRNVVPNADADLARRLLVVQHEAYAREAELIQDDRIPPLHEDLDTLRSAPVTWVAAFDDAELLGAASQRSRSGSCSPRDPTWSTSSPGP
ncbi:acetyltransferase [Actinotalea ferrariae CF5-4]|uniref:Acetyltransferase n=1 Tax=Actinotalea ferrariae CF5-4 TaxID=948458 RepID=A0A021VYS1_9CELL|nr:hypothetical protein [Actinotalea ferrariae]EYR65165.1 acetyltransferase [Actinotalea ferrariae CF5-4]